MSLAAKDSSRQTQWLSGWRKVHAPAKGPQLDDEEEPELPVGFIRRVIGSQRVLILGVLIGLFIVFGATAPSSFLTPFNLMNLLTAAAVLLILATGETFVLVTAGVDLSVGSVLVFSGVIAAKIMSNTGGSNAGWTGVTLGIIAGIAVGTAWGGVNGFLVAWGKIPPLIVTLGTFGAALGVAEVITGGQDISNTPNHLVDAFGIGKLVGIPVFVLIAAVIVVVALLLLNLMTFGRHALAIGANVEAARHAGIRVERHLLKVYALAGMLAGIAGVLSLARFSNTTIAGHAEDNLSAITAAVVGGTSLFGGYGTMVGTVVGTFIPVVLLNGLVILNLNSFWQQVLIGGVLILAVYVDQRRRFKTQR